MDLTTAPYTMIKAYKITPKELNKFHINPDALIPMIYPNFGGFNDTFVRASVGLSSVKNVKNRLVCYNRIGIRYSGQNVYANTANAFDILHADYLDMIDEDNVDGIECFTDFLNLKTSFLTRYNTELIPLIDKILKDVEMDVEFATPKQVTGFGYIYTPYTEYFKIINNDKLQATAKTRYDIENPINFSCMLNQKYTFSLSLHPKKKLRTNNTPKTILSGLRRVPYNSYQYNRRGNREGKREVFKDPCMTEFNLNDPLDEFATAYNGIIKEFNDNVEKLKDKHAGLYMLNSIGLKASTI